MDDFSPIYAGDTAALFVASFVYGDGSAVSLSGATTSMIMDNGAGIVKAALGTWTTDDAAAGLAHIDWNSADVATPGTWRLYITVTVGGKPRHADTKLLQILPVPALTT